MLTNSHFRFSTSNTPIMLTEYFSVIKLATKWGFEKERNRTIDLLTPYFINPSKMISIGQEYMVPQWPLEGYKRIIKESYPTLEAATTLGPKSFYYLMSLRDEYLQKLSLSSSSSKNKKYRSSSDSQLELDTKINTLIEQGHLEGALPPESPSLARPRVPTDSESGPLSEGNGKRVTNSRPP